MLLTDYAESISIEEGVDVCGGKNLHKTKLARRKQGVETPYPPILRIPLPWYSLTHRNLSHSPEDDILSCIRTGTVRKDLSVLVSMSLSAKYK